MNLSNKLILVLGLCLLLIYGSISIYLSGYLVRKLEVEAVREMEIVGDYLAAEATANQWALEEIVQNTANTFEELEIPERQIRILMKDILEDNYGELYGLCYAHLPEFKSQAYYVWKQNDTTVRETDLAADSTYHYASKRWFLQALSANEPVWTSPYEDEGGWGVNMVTYAVPVRDRSGNTLAFLTGDMSMEWLNQLISDAYEARCPYTVFIVDDVSDKIIAHQNKDYILNKTYQEVYGDKFKQPSDFAKNMRPGHEILEGTQNGQTHFMIRIPLDTHSWSVYISFSREDILNNLTHTKRFMDIAFLAGFLILFIAVILVTNRIITPLRELSAVVKKTGKGQLDIRIPYTGSTDEIGELSKAFEQMQTDLKTYIERIKKATEEASLIRNELLLGHKIQESLLPQPDALEYLSDKYIITGYQASAKEVGGDLYDYFELEDGNICFLLGDVSGKGVPSALHMAGIRATVRAYAKQGKTPAEIIFAVNNELAANNELCMFVTLFCAVTRIQEHTVIYSNAGHECPYIVRRYDQIEQVQNIPQPAAGIIRDFPYKDSVIALDPEEILFIYSDGLTDAENSTGAQFGRENVEAILKTPLSPYTLIRHFREELNRFCGTAEPFDDVTLLAFCYSSNKTRYEYTTREE